MSRRFALVALAALALAVPSYAQDKPAKKLKPGTYAHFVTNKGNFTVRLLTDKAPKTVANFVGLAEGTIDPVTGRPGKSKPYYNGVTFHRIIDGFMIQGGDPTGTGTGGPGYRIPDELDKSHHFDKAGIMAMANTGTKSLRPFSRIHRMLRPQRWRGTKSSHSIPTQMVILTSTLSHLLSPSAQPPYLSPTRKIQVSSIRVSKSLCASFTKPAACVPMIRPMPMVSSA